MNVMDVVTPWVTVNESLGLNGPIRDEEHYEALLSFVDACFARFGADEFHPVFTLLDVVADRIRDYEERVHPWPALAPHDFLRLLMDEHGLNQKDLPEVGPQSVVSNLLCGKRKINLRQAKALAVRFKLPMEVFVL